MSKIVSMITIYFYIFVQITSENRWDSGSQRRNSIFYRRIAAGENRQRQMTPRTYPDRIQASSAELMDEEYFWVGLIKEDGSFCRDPYWF